jgi:translation initiation factor RLI1
MRVSYSRLVEGESKIIRNVGIHVAQLVTLLVGHDAILVVYLSPTVVVQKSIPVMSFMS